MQIPINHKKFHRFKVLISAILVFVFTFSLVSITNNNVQAFVLESVFFSVAKNILIKAVKFGLDKAGEAYLKEAWPYAKIVIDPIFDLFPNLLSKDPQKVAQATDQAVNALDNNPELISKIEQRFENLEYGQKEILDQLHIIEEILSDHEHRIRRLEIAANIDTNKSLEGSRWKLSLETIRLIRSYLESAKNDFIDIKGDRLESFDAYTSKLRFPGAYSCLIDPRDEFTAASLECNIIDSDFQDNISPSLVWFTASELVANIEKAIPSDWERKYPRGWDKSEGLVFQEVYPPDDYHLYDEKRLRSETWLARYQTKGEFYFQEPNNPKGRRIFVYFETDTRPEEVRSRKRKLGGIEYSIKMLGPAYGVRFHVVAGD